MTLLQGVTTPRPCRLLTVALLLLTAGLTPAQEGRLGLFTDHTGIGAPKHDGVVARDAANGTYTIGGSGANMWFRTDSFHFVWKKVEGNIAIEAAISFPQAGGNAHRKGLLMIRQTLDPDSAYADVALHGDGLTSLQFRETAGDVTHEVQTVIKNPKRLRLEKAGDYIYMSLAGDDGVLRPSGSSTRLLFKGPFYLGLGVCAHDENAFEIAEFSNVVVGPPSTEVTKVRSSLEYVKIPSGDRVCVYPSREMITAAVWAADGSLYFAQNNRGFQVPASGGPAVAADASVIPAGQPDSPSPDGKWTAAFEHQGGDAVLTLRPTAGGDTRALMRLPDQKDAPAAISWSPDSTKIAYVRSRPALGAK